MEEKKISTVAGLDVVSTETDLPEGALREANNVVIQKAGGFNRRDGYVLSHALPKAHSIWRNKAGTLCLCVASGVLYQVSDLTVTSIASGLWDNPVRYAEAGGFIYISGGKILRIDQNMAVTVPGVTSLCYFAPTLSQITGAIPAGRYGFSITALSDTGEESGMSAVEWIDLAAPSGVMVTFPGVAPAGVTHYNVYRTTANDEIFYRCAKIAVAAYGNVVSGETDKMEPTRALDLLPFGGELASYRGRLYSALGSFLFYSEPYAHGLYQRTSSFIPFPSDCDRMVQPVEGGIFVGTDDTVYFLSGVTPKEFQLTVAAGNGAFMHSSLLVPGAQFGEILGKDKSVGDKDVAIWLSPHGYQIGLPDGQVVSVQKDRILLADVARAPSHVFTRAGVKQIVSSVESMTLGDPAVIDSTP